MEEIVVKAKVECLSHVQDMVQREMDAVGCGKTASMRIAMAVEEVFVNICNYAYEPNVGYATVRVSSFGEPASITITFIDQGRPFNPLERAKPDIEQPLNEREMGGLGIFLVRQMMDDVSYEYSDGHNILTLTKAVGP